MSMFVFLIFINIHNNENVFFPVGGYLLNGVIMVVIVRFYHTHKVFFINFNII